MKIIGQRPDGSMLLSLGAGIAVIMRGAFASRPIDLGVAHGMGPWTRTDDSLEQRRAAQKSLDRARVVAIQQFKI